MRTAAVSRRTDRALELRPLTNQTEAIASSSEHASLPLVTFAAGTVAAGTVAGDGAERKLPLWQRQVLHVIAYAHPVRNMLL